MGESLVQMVGAGQSMLDEGEWLFNLLLVLVFGDDQDGQASLIDLQEYSVSGY